MAVAQADGETASANHVGPFERLHQRVQGIGAVPQYKATA